MKKESKKVPQSAAFSRENKRTTNERNKGMKKE